MTVLDLFAGPGGWDLAARRLGLDPVGLELDDHACATRRAAGLRTMQCDVAAVDLDSGWVGLRLAGLIASPPCQAFSMAGSGAGRAALDAYLDAVARTAAGAPPSRDELDEACHDDRAHLVLEPLRWALALRPRWVALEQVEPVLPIWEATADALRAAGYGAWTGVLSAERYGVPQTRRRAILLASLDRAVGEPAATHQRYVAPRRRDEATESLFEPPEPERIVAPEDRDLLPWVSMAEALGWGMIARPGLTFAAGTKSGGASSDGTGGTGARRILEGERAAGRWADVELVNGDLDHAARRRADEPAPTIKNGDLSGRRWVLRVNGQPNAAVRGADEPAPTITTGGHDLANRIWLRAGTNP
ncbi:MAG TPA: DNA cytosine methyltransferase, partial [Solirubrobacteraceae bacterium]